MLDKSKWKQRIRSLPCGNFVESTIRKFMRFFDGRDIADGMIDFNTLPPDENIKYNQNMTDLSLIYNIYSQMQANDFVTERLYQYADYSSEILRHLTIILIDDGSPYPIALPENLDLHVVLLRINQDIPWNGGGARNLGACYAKDEKLIFCDIDHLITEKALSQVLHADLHEHSIYLFEWKKPLYVIPNIYAISRKTFFEYHGYDETYSGFYGDDVFFRLYLEEAGCRFVRSGWEAVNQVDTYLGEHNLSRSLVKARNRKSHRIKLKHSCKMLCFPWIFVADRERKDYE